MRAAEVLWALAAALPMSAAGLMAGAALERAGVSAKVRERVWTLAFWLGPAASVVALLADALPQPATVQITVVLRGTPLGALSQATRALAQAPHIDMPRAAEALLGAVAAGAALRLMQLGRAWLALQALRRKAVAAPAATLGAARTAGLKPSVPIKLCAQAPTAIAAGLLRPEILLPARLATAEVTALVCRHEAQHIRRGDNLRLMFEQLAGVPLWFDPLRGVVHRRLLAAREERCDAQALAGCTWRERALYARALLEALTQPVPPAAAVALTGAGRSCAMSRLSAIIEPRPAARRPVLTIGLCALLALAGGGIGYAASQAIQPSPGWMRTAARAMASVSPAQAPTARRGDAPAAAAARGEGRGLAPRAKRVQAAAFAPTARLAGPNLADGAVDLVMFVNGDMDTGDLSQMVRRLAQSRGIPVTPETQPQLEQAVLRSAAYEPHIDVAADYVETFDGSTRFSGNVEISGDLKHAFEGASIRVDERPAPVGMALSSRLAADAVEFKRITGIGDAAGKFLSVHIHGLHLAQ